MRKFFAFKNSAYIGSANAPQSSANHLMEAVVETKESKLVSAARKYVRSLCLNLVTYNEARQMVKHYKPPKFFGRQINLAGTRSKLALLPPIKVVVLERENL